MNKFPARCSFTKHNTFVDVLQAWVQHVAVHPMSAQRVLGACAYVLGDAHVPRASVVVSSIVRFVRVLGLDPSQRLNRVLLARWAPSFASVGQIHTLFFDKYQFVQCAHKHCCCHKQHIGFVKCHKNGACCQAAYQHRCFTSCWHSVASHQQSVYEHPKLLYIELAVYLQLSYNQVHTLTCS